MWIDNVLRRCGWVRAEAYEDLEKSFDLRWEADMRAICRWQAETGKTLTWPDHADLCVWLLGKLDEQRQQMQRIVGHYDTRSELYTNDADVAAGLAGIARLAVNQVGIK